MSRRDARDVAFKLVFEYTFSGEEKREVVEEYIAGMDADDASYVNEVYYGVISHYEELSQKIAETSENFAFDRVFKVDFALLLLSLYEILYINSIPFKVSANEALNLAKKYSSEKCASFINGVLSKFAR